MSKPKIFFYLPEHQKFNHFSIFFLKFFEEVLKEGYESQILFEPLIDIYKTNKSRISGKKDELYFKKIDLSWYNIFDYEKYKEKFIPIVRSENCFWENGQKIKPPSLLTHKDDILIIPDTHINEIPQLKKLNTKIYVVVFNYSMLATQEYFFFTNDETINGFIVTDSYIYQIIEKLQIHNNIYKISFPIISDNNDKDFFSKKPILIINDLYYSNNIFFQSLVKTLQIYLPQYLFIKISSLNNLQYTEYLEALRESMFMLNIDNMNSFNPSLLDAALSNMSILSYKQEGLEDYFNIYENKKFKTFKKLETFEIVSLLDEFIYENMTNIYEKIQPKISNETFEEQIKEFSKNIQ